MIQSKTLKKTNQGKQTLIHSLINSVIEGDELVARDPDEELKLIAFSQKPGLYDILSKSLAPSIFGMDDVKKGVLLQLFGGNNKFNGDSTTDGVRIRYNHKKNIHCKW